MQDPNPLPWGAQDRFQAHFIVRNKVTENPLDYTARTILSTTGHFGSKKVTSIKWNGGKIADVLNSDTSLCEMITNQTPNDAIISVEPTNEGIRIYGKRKNSCEFGISKELFQIYDTVAQHLKKFTGLTSSSVDSKQESEIKPDDVKEKEKPIKVSKIRGALPKGWN